MTVMNIFTCDHCQRGIYWMVAPILTVTQGACCDECWPEVIQVLDSEYIHTLDSETEMRICERAYALAGGTEWRLFQLGWTKDLTRMIDFMKNYIHSGEHIWVQARKEITGK